MARQMKSASTLAWSQLASLAGFAVLAFAAVSVDWQSAQGQEAKTKAKDAKAKDFKKAFAEFRKSAKDGKDDKKIVQALRPTPGQGQKLDAAALSRIIDQEIGRKLQEEKLKASPRADDAEFLRRASLDLVGAIPSADKTIAFLESKDSNKRAKLIDDLLADPRFGQFHGELWAGMMLPRESNNRKLDHTPLVKWLAEQFNKNTPLNTVVYDLVTSTGNQDENGAVTYFVANPTVDKITDSVTKMFLGVQLQCAQCHNHPFTDWKQKEYWGMAQFFMKVKLTANPQQAAKKGVSPGIVENNGPVGKKNQLPESAMKVSAKFLGSEEPKLSTTEPYRPVLAKWLVGTENPYFARAMVNRFWQHMFGRGIVNPVDDMHENNNPSHPELLSALTEQFKASGFDVKYLVRAICNSDAYQRTSRPVEGNGDDREFYSHRAVRAMLPEQLFESLMTVTGRDEVMKKRPELASLAQKKGGQGGPREAFLNFFRVVDEPDVMEYQSGIPQALRMMNAAPTNGLTGVVARTVKTAGGTEPAKVVEQIYLTGLSRRPTTEETQRLVTFVTKHPTNATAAYADIFWAILNSSEFVLNH